MLGPEQVPYGSIAAYATQLSAEHHLSNWQTLRFLINDIPQQDLATVGQKVYAHAAAVNPKPGDPEFHGALEGLIWADELENHYADVKRRLGMAGAVLGGAVGVAGETILMSTEQEVSPPYQFSFAEASYGYAMIVGPVLVLGATSAYLAKKFTPHVMKYWSRVVVKRVDAVNAGTSNMTIDYEEDRGYEDDGTSPYIYATPDGHLEQVEEESLFKIAERKANQRGCSDERAYADCLLADLPSSDIEALTERATARCNAVLNGDDLKQGPLYNDLLRDMQIWRDIWKRRDAARSILQKTYRGIGYAAFIGFSGFMTSETVHSEADVVPMPLFLSLAAISGMTAFVGFTWGAALSKRFMYLARLQSKWRAAKASAQESSTE